MSEVHKTATIDAPAGELFDIVENPENLPKYVPNVSQVVDIDRTDRRIGDRFRVIYKVMGATFDEKFTTTEHDRPKRITSAFEGGMTGTFRWTFEPEGSKTKVSVDIEYRLAGGALGKAVDALMLERTNEKSIDGMLENLRRMAAKTAASSNR
jgi:uncharacterized membrane protein